MKAWDAQLDLAISRLAQKVRQADNARAALSRAACGGYMTQVLREVTARAEIELANAQQALLLVYSDWQDAKAEEEVRSWRAAP